ncbi:MAG TPA: NAD(P)H-hydrate dehydratase [Chitinophagaceae bacterium]|nr:NAD(P)H-hydrate dehydratase [Chitinophagaceae bacterium]
MMKILNAEQIRQWDQFTIDNEPVDSIDLMERAAIQCVNWLEQHIPLAAGFMIFCGKGNNGGDGLAMARLMALREMAVKVYILEFGHKGTDDFQANLARLHQYPLVDIHYIQSETNFPVFPPGSVIIDALFGSGLNRKTEQVTAKLIDHINESEAPVISIDIPSGMFTDSSSKGNTIIAATHTLSFQSPKLAFLVPGNAAFIGDLHILPIGLHPAFPATVNSNMELTGLSRIRSIYRPRNSFAHKGTFGHALLVAGSYGKIGAAVLSASACLRSGVGLLTCHVPGCGYSIMQSSVPEAMILIDFNSSYATRIEGDLSKYKSIGVGPGLGTASETKQMLQELFEKYRHPMVLDADALNAISMDKTLLASIPANSILTPHPKEFERLFGKTENDFATIALVLEKARELQVIIVLKGHHSLVSTPDGMQYFNSTGNAGMATGGSGDVLTGLLTGLLAQGYSPAEAAILGVYLHGLAGDIAAGKFSQEAMVAGDIAGALGMAFLELRNV